MRVLSGIPAARGFASGHAFLYRNEGDSPVPEYKVPPGQEPDEVERLKQARKDARRDIEGIIAALRERTARDDVKVFESHLMILDDPLLIEGSERYIMQERYNAVAASRKVMDEIREQFMHLNDPYFRERVRDLDDVERRLIDALLKTCSDAMSDLKVPSVIVADDLTPSETIRLPRDLVLGFVTRKGSATSHVSLLARSLGIPAVVGLGDAIDGIMPGDDVLVDGVGGIVTSNPNPAVRTAFEELRERDRASISAVKSGFRAGTLADGSNINLYANVHPGLPLDEITRFGAGGIGLLRSEYLWLDRELEPTEDEQFAAYREAASFAAGISGESSATVRMLDIGGDKTIAGISSKEANPFLGNRSIRYLLSNPETFRTQLRAVLRASVFGKVRVMYPMVSCVDELRECKLIMDDVKRQLDGDGVAYDRAIKVGAMIEVPSAAINADAIAGMVDFLSIGTNDLVQYTMAADRTNEKTAHLYQPLNPAVLHLVRNTMKAAKRRQIPVSVCGESAADPVEGTLWVAMGADTLSMSAAYIPPMAAILRKLTRGDLDEYEACIMSLDPALPASEIRAQALDWLQKRVGDLNLSKP